MEFYTVKELCEMLKLSERTIRKLLTSCELQSSKIGGSFRVSDEQLMQYLKKGETQKPERVSRYGRNDKKHTSRPCDPNKPIIDW